MEERKRRKEANKPGSEGGHQTTSRNHAVPHIRKTILRKAIPYILVGCIVSSSVMMSYNEAREVKAVAVVDDIILLTALLATAGIAYVGISEYWTNGQWLEDEDSPVLDPEMAEWGQGFADRMQSQWDNDVLQKAIELGYVDPETGEYIGNLEGTGGSGDGDNDDNNKFPTWQKLKELVAKNGGNLSQALGTGAGFLLGAYGATMLESSEKGAKIPGGLPEKYKLALDDIENNVIQYCQENNIDFSEFRFRSISINEYSSPKGFHISIYYAKEGMCAWINTHSDGEEWLIHSIQKKTEFLKADYSTTKNPIYNEVKYDPYSSYSSSNRLPIGKNSYIILNVPICSTKDEALAYLENPYLVYPDTYVNPSTIGKSTALTKKLAETGGDLTKSLYKNVTLPTTEQLNQYFEDLNNAEDEEEKQKIMDEFVDSLVSPTENPNPDPDNPDKPVIPDTPDNPTNNDTFLADLKHLFPFCIPFDLVDCFKLFNAEPVTPRVEFPVHFGIINYEHTFVIDLKDFNNVAVVCRSTFLIVYMIGLILATRALIKG